MGSAWSSFLHAVDAARDGLRFRDHEDCLFRGHSAAQFQLFPTLQRHCAAKKSVLDIRELEGSLYFEFRARARELHHAELDDWDVLFSMRHHGLATRLLDWTEMLGIAVYFALAGAEPGSGPHIWLLNAFALNERSFQVRDMVAPEYLAPSKRFRDYLTRRIGEYSEQCPLPWTDPVAIYPMQKNNRLQAQRGYFTIHGENSAALENIAPEVLRRVELPEESWKDAWKFLDDAGINEYTVYPDLDGLTRHLHMKYGVSGPPASKHTRASSGGSRA